MASEFKNYSFDNDNIAARLLRYRTESGLTRDDVIANAGTSMSKSTLQGWEGAKREASLTGIIELANLYKVSVLDIIFGNTGCYQGNSSGDEYCEIPLYSLEISAGHGSFTVGTLKPKHYLSFRKNWVRARGYHYSKLAAFSVRGDSMVGAIPDGANVIVNTEENKAIDGSIFVIRIDDRLWVKRIQWLPAGNIRLISENDIYESFDIDLKDEGIDFEVIGQVVHVAFDLHDRTLD